MSKRFVIKVGTGVLSDAQKELDISVLEHLVSQIAQVKKAGNDVILVSSGAMGAGRTLISPKKSDKIAEKQVLAAVGQVKLMTTYAEAFKKSGLLCAQVLATKEDFRDRTHYLNMRTCFENLLASGVIPVVNENDVVATTELLFTDNDELAGLVASQLNADTLVIITSVDGFLTGPPSDINSRVIDEIDLKNGNDFEKYISSEKSDFGRGGMGTKFNIAKKLAQEGIGVHIANGRKKNTLTDILLEHKKIGTTFIAREKASSLKRRLAHSEGLTKGAIVINAGAEEIIVSKTKPISLLPVGVIKVEGDFKKGDIIEIRNQGGKKIGFGIARYDSQKALESIGKKRAGPIVHHDHMFIE